MTRLARRGLILQKMTLRVRRLKGKRGDLRHREVRERRGPGRSRKDEGARGQRRRREELPGVVRICISDLVSTAHTFDTWTVPLWGRAFVWEYVGLKSKRQAIWLNMYHCRDYFQFIRSTSKRRVLVVLVGKMRRYTTSLDRYTTRKQNSTVEGLGFLYRRFAMASAYSPVLALPPKSPVRVCNYKC
jgi:hypothetical protein